MHEAAIIMQTHTYTLCIFVSTRDHELKLKYILFSIGTVFVSYFIDYRSFHVCKLILIVLQCLCCCHHSQNHCESSPGSFDECRVL